MAGFLAGSPLLRSQQDSFRDHSRIPGLNELVTALDFEPAQPGGFRLGGTDTESGSRRQPRPDGNRDPRHQNGFPHHGVAFLRSQHASPRWRTGHLSGQGRSAFLLTDVFHREDAPHVRLRGKDCGRWRGFAQHVHPLEITRSKRISNFSNRFSVKGGRKTVETALH